MAQKVKVLLLDDIDGSGAVETVRFGLDGTEYEIDLNGEHADELRAVAAPYIAKARRIAVRGRRSPRSRSADVNGADSGKIRDWAKENGFEVKDRGRVPGDLVAKYEAAKSS